MIYGRLSPGNVASQGKKPGIPTSVSASPGDSQATIAGTAPSYLGKSGSIQYYITVGALNQTAPGLSYAFTGLSNGTPYAFTVQALTPYGVLSDGVTTNSVTPIVSPVTPPVTPPVSPPVDPCSGFDVAANCTASCGGGGTIVNGAGWSAPQFATGGPNELGGQCAAQGCTGLTMNIYTKSCCPTIYCFIECTGCPAVQPPVGPVSPCAGNTCTFAYDEIVSCTDACGNSGFQVVDYYNPSIGGCVCPPVYGPCQAASGNCGTPTNNGEGAGGGNGWSWVTKNTYIPTQGGVCTDTSLYSGSVWYEYSKCGCSNFNLFVSCIPAQGGGVQPAVEPAVTPPVEPAVQPAVEPAVTPPVEPAVQPAVEPAVTPPVEPVVDCAACGGGPGLCFTVKGETGCI